MTILHLLAYLLLLCIAVGSGLSLLNGMTLFDGKTSPGLRFGAAYLVGVSLSIALPKSFSIASGSALVPSYMALAVILAITLPFISLAVRYLLHLLRQQRILAWLSFLIVFASILMAFWLNPLQPSLDPYDSIGSLHSVRYAWLSNYISESNSIPIISQNHGQSILAYVAGIVGGRAPFLYLWLWLISSIVFLAFFVYGVFREYGLSTRSACFATFLFMLGGTSLSLTHVLVIDSGSPFALNGYTDSILGVMSVLFFIIIYNQGRRKNVTLGAYVVSFTVSTIVLMANFSYAPQNIILLFPFIVYISYYGMKRGFDGAYMLPVLLGAFITSFVLAIPQGGMLTPRFLIDSFAYPGLMGSPVGKGLGISINPGIPFHHGFPGSWIYGHGSTLSSAREYYKNLGIRSIPHLAWLAETIFFTSLRNLFFPLVGLVSLYFSGKGLVLSPSSSSLLPTSKTVAILGGISLAIGVFFSSFIALSGYKWELSRFLIPGISLGMIGVSWTSVSLMRNNRIGYRLCGLLIAILLTLGSTLSALTWASYNAYRLASPGKYNSPISTFLGAGPEVGRLK